MHEIRMNNSINLLSFETFKTIAPLIACVLCFVFFLFVFKFLFKTNRYNPVIYICSLAVVVVAYFAFIKMFNFRRLDYFMDGVIFCAQYVNSFLKSSIEKVVAPIIILSVIYLTPVIQCGNVFIALVNYVFTTNVDKIILVKLTLQNLKFSIKCVFKNAITYINSAINCLVNVSSVHKINCVYSC